MDFTKLVNDILTWLVPNKCPKCNSYKLNKGYWVRGWNNLCEQASGDRGVICFDCGHIQWDQTLEEYKKSLPNWCVAYEPKMNKEE